MTLNKDKRVDVMEVEDNIDQEVVKEDVQGTPRKRGRDEEEDSFTKKSKSLVALQQLQMNRLGQTNITNDAFSSTDEQVVKEHLFQVFNIGADVDSNVTTGITPLDIRFKYYVLFVVNGLVSIDRIVGFELSCPRLPGTKTLTDAFMFMNAFKHYAKMIGYEAHQAIVHLDSLYVDILRRYSEYSDKYENKDSTNWEFSSEFRNGWSELMKGDEHYDLAMLFLKQQPTSMISTPVKMTNSTSSDLNRSPAFRNLNVEFARFGSFHAMPATPLSLKNIKPTPRKGQCFSIQDFPTSQERILHLIAENVVMEFDDRVLDRVNQMKAMIANEDLREMTVKMYYRILTLMVQKESQRIPNTEKLQEWIHDADERFHKPLFVCCMEVVRYAFQMEGAPLNDILAMYNIKAFDFLLIIEGVIKTENQLTWIVVRRLKEIEERMLESEVFSIPDPIYTSNFEADSPRKAVEVIATYKPQVFGSKEFEEEEPVKHKVTGIEFFYRKLFRLLHLRLGTFSDSLLIPKDTMQKIWNMIVYTVENEIQLKLLYRRHVDQILICSVYAVCKLCDHERSFKEILQAYRDQPQYLEATFKKILKDNESNETEEIDIIKFYNKVYIPKLRHTIYSLKDVSRSAVPASPLPQTTDFGTPRRISTTHAIYVSPLKPNHLRNSPAPSTLKKNLMTPMTKKLYSFGESPSKVRNFNAGSDGNQHSSS